ncbi:MAG: MOSC domain-containing protein [Chloracidobacterium sp.]|nr:MOSC domain-containing protein [Chloracidobacterium sp.]
MFLCGKKSDMHIAEINIYPIKSLKGISVGSAVIEERGLQYDRRWMLTDREGMFFTQREFPRMATIAVAAESGQLKVESEGHGVMHVPFEPDMGERGRVTVWNSVCDAEIYNGQVSEWFSDVLGTNCQLVYMPDTSRRGINPKFNLGDDVVSFADGYPLMVIGEGSLADLNEKIANNAEKEHPGGEFTFEPLPMNRFRPNLVVAETDAFAEDAWQKIRIGEAAFRSTKPCERCVITTVEQSVGEFAGKEPLKTLATYRMAKDVIPDRYESLGVGANAVLFGQNLIAETPGATISVGGEIVALG